MHNVVARSPGNLQLLRRDLERQVPIPDGLWRLATRFHLTGDVRPHRTSPFPIHHRRSGRCGQCGAEWSGTWARGDDLSAIT